MKPVSYSQIKAMPRSNTSIILSALCKDIV
jgi:hypothetical protein